MNAHAALFPSHTSFITLRKQREKRASHYFDSKEGFFNSIGRKEEKKERPGPRVSMVTLALLLFVLGRRCNKSAGREMTGQGV